jgi:hypothetical protein
VKKLALAALLAGTALTGVPAAHAGGCPDPHDPLGPCGRKCTFNSATDVTREAGWQTGAIAAGPLVTGESGTLKCTMHVNNNTHSGAAVVTETQGDTGGVAVVMAPRPLNYPATAADDVVICTEWDGASGTQYWVGGNPAVPTDLGHWSTNPGDICGVPFSFEPNDPECSIWLAIDKRLGTNIAEVWQDCEPYQPII